MQRHSFGVRGTCFDLKLSQRTWLDWAMEVSAVYFTIRKNSKGEYWWRAKADGNNETLAASEMLSSKRACLEAISLVKAEAAAAPIRDQTGKPYSRKRI